MSSIRLKTWNTAAAAEKKHPVENLERQPPVKRGRTATYPAFIHAPMIYQYIDEQHNAARADQIISEMIARMANGQGGSDDTTSVLFLMGYGYRAEALDDCIYKLSPLTRSCLDHIWSPKAWYCINKRCRKCMKPAVTGDCVECVIPILAGLSTSEWLKTKCKVCHQEKSRNSLLCGRGGCFLKYVMVTKPPIIPIIGWVNNCKCVAGTIRIGWANTIPSDYRPARGQEEKSIEIQTL